MSSARLATSRNPKLNPMPATGCRPCAALPMMTQRGALVRVRLSQGKRIRHAAADFEESPQAKPKAALYFGEKFLVRPRHGRLRGILGQRQYQRAAAAVQRQQRQGTAGRESLVGHVVVKALRQYRGDHRRLAIVAHLRGDAESAAHGGLRAIGGHDELGIDRARGARLGNLDLDPVVVRP